MEKGNQANTQMLPKLADIETGSLLIETSVLPMEQPKVRSGPTWVTCLKSSTLKPEFAHHLTKPGESRAQNF